MKNESTAAELHTFGFADLAGFTALTEAHGDHLAADLALKFAAGVRELLDSVGGGDLKLIGDAAMVRCSQASAAVELALLIMDGLPGLADCPAIRVGMNTGPAAARDGDWFGSAVNLAARVAALAAGGEVLVTETTRVAAGDLPSVEWEPLGEHQFRNMRETVAVIRVQRRDAVPLATVIDPVCRMQVHPDNAAGRLRFGDGTYFFCSLDCAASFAAEPGAYSP